MRNPITKEQLSWLQKQFPNQWTCAAETLKIYGRDETEDLEFAPEILIWPTTTEAVAKLLEYANQEGLAVTPRGGGTGLSGGALPVSGGIVLSLERMNQIIEIDSANQVAICQPGVITEVLQDAVADQGLFYPPDPASRGSCQLGGNLVECSGGPRAIKYGVTRDYVRGLTAILPNGALIKHGGKFSKNATGYNITQLLIGSEGTLAVITEIILKLLPLPKERLTVMVPFQSLMDACHAVNQTFENGIAPSALEIMERDAIAAAQKHLDKPYPHSDAAAHLLFEFDGNSRKEIAPQLETLTPLMMRLGAQDVLLADQTEKQNNLWLLRRAIGEAIRSISPYKEEDTVVPRTKIAALISGVKEIGIKYGIKTICYGHAGNGNIHVNLLKTSLPQQSWQEQSSRAIEEIFQHAVGLGGTISGEHGIGYSQKSYLPIAIKPAEMELMRKIKTAFDPNGILNPHKIFPDPS